MSWKEYLKENEFSKAWTKEQDFEWEVACILEEEKEWNRAKLRKYGYRLGVPY